MWLSLVAYGMLVIGILAVPHLAAFFNTVAAFFDRFIYLTFQ
jgi:hypothetical protein